ncbi:MAG: phosphoenolpyruvate--protein phosphotransferase [Ignavibacteria bacterium]|nr:phosphoenolpyruvate--protein phosphotransferase [Ignavibacteria bacterium]
MKKIKIEEEKLYDLKDLPCETIDNKKIVLTANIELDQEIDFTKDCGLEGIGLYRTEYLFLEKGNFPSEIEQIEEYTKISEVVEPNIVTIRTYDIGGDKVLPTSQKEDNPFLGWRGIRICLDKVNIFKEQLRAILVSSVRKNVRIMLPMISSLCEVRQSKKVLSEVKNELRDNKIPFDDNIKLGIMIEVPSACLLAEELAKEVDFFSIGTNDLIQYTLAVDRGNELISGMFREFHPAVLRMMKMVVDAAHKNNIKVSICGEMASISVAAPVLVGLGIDELSIIPSSFLEIKKIIRSMKYVEAKNLTEEILKMNTTDDVEKRIMEFFEKNLILNTN